MRVGQNPARYIDKVAQPAEITVCVVNFIPFLSGYYEQSLEVLKLVVESLHSTREAEHPYDVMVFDNRSCTEVREYLLKASEEDKIQYLVLSDTNIGKIGAWNYMFGAAQGKYIAFSDGDIVYRPGWLSASLEILNTFPNVGMVTGRPLFTPADISSSTYEWAEKENVVEKGPFLSWEVSWEHGRSLGLEEPPVEKRLPMVLSRVTCAGKQAYIGAAHFQFLSKQEVLKKIIPLPSEQPMRGERVLDNRINDMKLLRLTTTEALVAHMGNRLTEPEAGTPARGKTSLMRKILWAWPIRSILLGLNHRIFQLYFSNPK